ncbi:VOC family protein [Marinactinospora thermotolerans]|uniref:VOC domain-containing protein n=1 Tax=Marinactinospora thermotolerans DSM 45154 TaxID=1122192 RepID=A0A1T4RWX5_9ACTN|nr:VOC family protein [Marinactinospora thermotolerans]SKA20081.1 hypothetical protein SAMN02745673_03039 [Marinactinospora thermotolerans DSM 45154]
MNRKIFVNLPVADLKRSVDFFTALGFTFDQRFTDDNATCMIVGPDSSVMLLVRDFFEGFTMSRKAADTTTQAEAIIALSAESRQEVDAIVDAALASGGAPSIDTIDQGAMYSRSFQDPDGHLWEVIHMDIAALEEETE